LGITKSGLNREAKYYKVRYWRPKPCGLKSGQVFIQSGLNIRVLLYCYKHGLIRQYW